MACTIRELQLCEYDILCTFSKFCDDHSIEYVLHYGTLLGAIRHNGFIPWDDDVDVIMSYKNFKKFIKLFKKSPVDGYSLSWIDCDREYPLHFAKLRKDNTEMREYAYRGLKMNNGVWIDIFAYFDKPRTNFGVKIQEFCFTLNSAFGEKYLYREKRLRNEFVPEKSPVVRFVDKCPYRILVLIRKFLLAVASGIGKKNSEFVRSYDYNGNHNFSIERSFFEPSEKHIFEDQYFSISKNYDDLLKRIYGDYMIPVVSHSHINLDIVNLNKE